MSLIAEDDTNAMESMGYKQELHRGLDSLANFAFGYTEVSVLTGLTLSFMYGLRTGGPVTLISSWLITYFFTMCVALSLGEICSAYPSAGSVYHWSGMIVPKKWGPLSSYLCGWANFLGLFSFAGYEASTHFAEETHSSRVSAPLGMINTYILTGPTPIATVNIFIYACGSKYGSFLCWLIVLNIFLAGISSVAVSGRITFALLRDGAFPHSEKWSKVNESTKSPISALLVVYTFSSVLVLLPLLSVTAFVSIMGICTIGFDISYAIPIVLKQIFAFDKFPHTPMSLGKFSNIINILAASWLIFTSILLFFPTTYPVTDKTMNWTVLVVFGFGSFSYIYWILYAKDNFQGPKQGKGDIKTNSNDEITSLLSD
eukprot:gene16841-22326_t